MPSNDFSCQHHQKMPTFDVPAKRYFFMPNHFKKGQISGIWRLKCQHGIPDWQLSEWPESLFQTPTPLLFQNF